MKLKLLILPFLLLSFVAKAQIPAGYYNSANGLSGAPLKTALYNIIKGHTTFGYNALWTAFQTTDDKPDGNVWDMYSNCTFTFGSDQCGSYSIECDCYNREHSFPQSWFNSSSPMVSDLFHIYPTDGKVNGMRGNYPFGEVGTATYTSQNGSKLGNSASTGYSNIVFEPIDEYKGDFARSYFYMATRYENVIVSWQNNTGADEVLNGTTYPCYDQWFIDLLLAWNAADPVSQKEIDRNNTIYTSFQHNRNPYIDHPEYVNWVWGGIALAPEPESYPEMFSAHNIHLQWVDATGTILPEGYLVRMGTNGFQSINNPQDGIVYPDSQSDLNVPYGVQNVWFTNLIPNTIYYFKLFGFTGSGLNIDYKTDGNVPQMQQTTGY
jgi:endonuclease I